MYFEVMRQALMTPLKMIAGVVERKQVTPILGHILVKIQDKQLTLTATDNEIELKYHMPIEAGDDGEMTLPALKLYDICRAFTHLGVVETIINRLRFPPRRHHATATQSRQMLRQCRLTEGDTLIQLRNRQLTFTQRAKNHQTIAV